MEIARLRYNAHERGDKQHRREQEMNHKFRNSEDERSPDLKGDLEAQLDELGDDPAQVGNRSAGQSGGSQALSSVEDASDQSVEELADTDQALETATVEGLEDAADHPERPVHTHEEYGRPDDVPPRRGNRNAA
jgi:hypothetical protein